jgi:hypothetical protein
MFNIIITSPSKLKDCNNVKGYASRIVTFNFLSIVALLLATIENPQHVSLFSL